MMRETPRDAAEQVAALPRRVAHAAHALLATTDEIGGPAVVAEIVVHDREALNVQSTSAALGRACHKHGLAENWGSGVWTPSLRARDLRGALEDRFLADTEEPSDR